MKELFGAFLRGINVNGNKIPKDALQQAFIGMGFSDARAVLNTGNVVFTADPEQCPSQELSSRIRQALAAAFGYHAPVFLRTGEELVSLCRGAGELRAPAGCHLYLLLCDRAGLPQELGELFAQSAPLPQERFIPLEQDAFWIVPKGSTLDSAFGAKVLGAKKYQNRLTSRSINTVKKMTDLGANNP